MGDGMPIMVIFSGDCSVGPLTLRGEQALMCGVLLWLIFLCMFFFYLAFCIYKSAASPALHIFYCSTFFLVDVSMPTCVVK